MINSSLLKSHNIRAKQIRSAFSFKIKRGLKLFYVIANDEWNCKSIGDKKIKPDPHFIYLLSFSRHNLIKM